MHEVDDIRIYVSTGDLSKLKSLVDKEGLHISNLELDQETKFTSLMLAVINSQPAIVEFLLAQEGIDVYKKNGRGNNVLHQLTHEILWVPDEQQETLYQILDAILEKEAQIRIDVYKKELLMLKDQNCREKYWKDVEKYKNKPFLEMTPGSGDYTPLQLIAYCPKGRMIRTEIEKRIKAVEEKYPEIKELKNPPKLRKKQINHQGSRRSNTSEILKTLTQPLPEQHLRRRNPVIPGERKKQRQSEKPAVKKDHVTLEKKGILSWFKAYLDSFFYVDKKTNGGYVRFSTEPKETPNIKNSKQR